MKKKFLQKILVFSLLLTISALHSQKSTKKKSLLKMGIISTNLNERDFTMSPDGSELYFTRSHFDNKARAILRVTKKEGKFGNPQVASFSGKFNDLEPFFSPDGKRLYFASNRNEAQTDEKGDYDIWFVERKKNGDWSTAHRLGDNINSDGDEFFPAVTMNGNLYFTASRKIGVGAEDIFISEFKNGSFQVAKPLDKSVNSENYEFNSYVNPEETLIIFSSYGRKDGFGGGDLYFSSKTTDGTWTPAKNLGADVNTKSLDYCPFYDESANRLYFASNISEQVSGKLTTKKLKQRVFDILNGYGNIYFLDYSFKLSGNPKH